jgi:hypothetical protein
MRKLIVLLWSLLRRLVHDLGVLLFVGVVLAGVAGWFVPPPGQRPRPGAGMDGEFADRPRDYIGVSVHVKDVWLPEPLFNLAKRESWSLAEERHQHLRNVLEREDWQVLFYAFTVRALQANGGVKYFHFIRYSYCKPRNVQELLEVMATAAGHPPKTDYYSAAAVHVVPAGTSPQELLDGMKAASLSHDSSLPSR